MALQGFLHVNQNRKLLAVHGPDAPHFLQGICTANVATPGADHTNFGRSSSAYGFPAAFLNAQGRLLHDVFIYPASHSAPYRDSIPEAVRAKYGVHDVPAFLIEMDGEYASELRKWLSRYKLRAKVDIRELDDKEWSIWSLWGMGERWTRYGSEPASSSEDAEGDGIGDLGCPDVRAPGMGRRIILPPNLAREDPGSRVSEYMNNMVSRDAIPGSLENSQAEESDLASYTVRRYLRGVAEGQKELAFAASLPQEGNLDFTGGIDFRKGCYVGQELTIRTHHTGVVRKRVLPVMLQPIEEGKDTKQPEQLLYDPNMGDLASLVSPGTDIKPEGKTKGRTAGKFLAGLGNVGLGLCRVEMMTDLVLTGEGEGRREARDFVVKRGAGDDNVQVGSEGDRHMGIKAFVPDWIRNQVKVKAPNARV
ncbi:MAG: ccr4 associated factor [Chrysothrix sp. TS-e1954]|nr:MAG: ccr4 associated factor [Chrysothrix sp. TS-e1954]